MELFLATAMAIHCQLHKLSSLCRETLHEMTTHSTQVGTVTCCHIVGDLHVTFQIKNQIYMLIPNSNVKNILTSATSFAENSQIQTLSFPPVTGIVSCHPSNVGETQGLRDALQEVKDASIISCRVHRSVTEGITTNLMESTNGEM